MKTIKYWLNQLDEPYKTLAISNSSEENLQYQDVCIYEALAGAFAWDLSVEGYDYWNQLYQKLKNENR